MNKINNMGSEVLDGFHCKPKSFNPDRPMMYYKTHVFICDGQRCREAYSDSNTVEILRELLKSLKLNRGTKRIKLSKTSCFGACRFRSVVAIYENSKADEYCFLNDALWLKKCHRFSLHNWKELFLYLSQNRDLSEKLGNDGLIPQSKA